jgi:hypothetical protein
MTRAGAPPTDGVHRAEHRHWLPGGPVFAMQH